MSDQKAKNDNLQNELMEQAPIQCLELTKVNPESINISKNLNLYIFKGEKWELRKDALLVLELAESYEAINQKRGLIVNGNLGSTDTSPDLLYPSRTRVEHGHARARVGHG